MGMKNTEATTDKTRKCREDCLNAKPNSECNCTCGTACHQMGVCDPESHRFGANGSFRKPTVGRFAA